MIFLFFTIAVVWAKARWDKGAPPPPAYLTSCSGKQSKRYQTLQSAWADCVNDSLCKGVYDGNCDNDNWRLCYGESRSSSKSCFYPISNSSQVCTDTNNGAKDRHGDGCDWYNNNVNRCGVSDDDDFNAYEMCCACQVTINKFIGHWRYLDIGMDHNIELENVSANKVRVRMCTNECSPKFWYGTGRMFSITGNQITPDGNTIGTLQPDGTTIIWNYNWGIWKRY